MSRVFECNGCGDERPCRLEIYEGDVPFPFDHNELKCVLDPTNQTSFNWTEDTIKKEGTIEVKIEPTNNVSIHMNKTIEMLSALIETEGIYEAHQISFMESARLDLISVFGHADIKRS